MFREIDSILNFSDVSRIVQGMYGLDRSCMPSMEEFRDAFSHGQLASKSWLLEHVHGDDILIVGGWIGLTAFMVANAFPAAKVTTLDVDQSSAEVAKAVNAEFGDRVRSVTHDMYDYDGYGRHDVVINTSGEHIEDLRKWTSKVGTGKKIVVQSNDARHIQGHVNCVDTAEELAAKVGLSRIDYAGTLDIPGVYRRFMVVGVV